MVKLSQGDGQGSAAAWGSAEQQVQCASLLGAGLGEGDRSGQVAAFGCALQAVRVQERIGIGFGTGSGVGHANKGS
jgi:hypothetical protein